MTQTKTSSTAEIANIKLVKPTGLPKHIWMEDYLKKKYCRLEE